MQSRKRSFSAKGATPYQPGATPQVFDSTESRAEGPSYLLQWCGPSALNLISPISWGDAPRLVWDGPSVLSRNNPNRIELPYCQARDPDSGTQAGSLCHIRGALPRIHHPTHRPLAFPFFGAVPRDAADPVGIRGLGISGAARDKKRAGGNQNKKEETHGAVSPRTRQKSPRLRVPRQFPSDRTRERCPQWPWKVPPR